MVTNQWNRWEIPSPWPGGAHQFSQLVIPARWCPTTGNQFAHLARLSTERLCVATEAVQLPLQLYTLSPSRQASYKLASSRFHLYISLLSPYHLHAPHPYTVFYTEIRRNVCQSRTKWKRIFTLRRSLWWSCAQSGPDWESLGSKEEDDSPLS